jgi:hypothetical protein
LHTKIGEELASPGNAGKGFLRLRTEAEGGLVVFVSDMGEKEALLTSDSDAFFTTPHYDGWPIALVNLDKIDHDELRGVDHRLVADQGAA